MIATSKLQFHAYFCRDWGNPLICLRPASLSCSRGKEYLLCLDPIQIPKTWHIKSSVIEFMALTISCGVTHLNTSLVSTDDWMNLTLFLSYS